MFPTVAALSPMAVIRSISQEAHHQESYADQDGVEDDEADHRGEHVVPDGSVAQASGQNGPRVKVLLQLDRRVLQQEKHSDRLHPPPLSSRPFPRRTSRGTTSPGPAGPKERSPSLAKPVVVMMEADWNAAIPQGLLQAGQAHPVVSSRQVHGDDEHGGADEHPRVEAPLRVLRVGSMEDASSERNGLEVDVRS